MSLSPEEKKSAGYVKLIEFMTKDETMSKATGSIESPHVQFMNVALNSSEIPLPDTLPESVKKQFEVTMAMALDKALKDCSAQVCEIHKEKTMTAAKSMITEIQKNGNVKKQIDYFEKLGAKADKTQPAHPRT